MSYKKGTPHPSKWKPGQSGNPKGKPKGAKNRTTEQMREFLKNLANENFERIQEDLDSMSPYNRQVILDKITSRFMPTLTQADITGSLNTVSKIVVSYADPVDEPKED